MATHTPTLHIAGLTPVPRANTESWRDQSPRLAGPRVTLRELTTDDVVALQPLITAPEVTRFISPPPPTREGLAAFITWSHRQRRAGEMAVFGLVPRGLHAPVGIVQVRQIEPEFRTAEWGVAIGSEWWGSGLFLEAARALFGFSFDVIGAHRLEARAAVANARAQAGLRKLGVRAEGILRQSLVTGDGVRHDQVIWSLLAEDWRRQGDAASALVH